MSAILNTRRSVYYWKCDREFAFQSLLSDGVDNEAGKDVVALLRPLLTTYFGDTHFELRPAGGQGNHITYLVDRKERILFLRLENGPERDDYMSLESHLLNVVYACGVPTPRLYHADASRRHTPFAWQLIEFLDAPDLNHFFKLGTLDESVVFTEIGAHIARWQSIMPLGFGPMDTAALRESSTLRGLHSSYPHYFYLNWERHLAFLQAKDFLPPSQIERFRLLLRSHEDLLTLKHGCLVHKDLALWNILGTAQSVSAIIDWDDAISGDPTDDLSLLACFHEGKTLSAAIRGYSSIRPLAPDFVPRFWLHLLRNMVVKAVIRLGAGYFDRQGTFFLLPSSGKGSDLKTFTRRRLEAACLGLENHLAPSSL